MIPATLDDLYGAIEWLELYDVAEDEDASRHFSRTVAAFLRREADRREGEAAARKVASEHGITMAHARRVVKAAKGAR